MVARSDLERVKKARDLQTRSEFAKTADGKRLVAVVYISKTLGLEVREAISTEQIGDRAVGPRPDTAQFGTKDVAGDSRANRKNRRASEAAQDEKE